MTRSRKFLTYATVGLYLSATAPGASIPPSAYRVGILRLRASTRGDEVAYRLLERRLQRWLENAREIPTRVTALEASLELAHAREAAEHARIRELARTVLEAEASTEAVAEREESIAAAHAALADWVRAHAAQRDLGPLLQRALLADAWQSFRRHRRQTEPEAALLAAARERVRAAILLHPALRIEGGLPWDLESAAGAAGFVALIDEVTSGLVRSCTVDIAVTPRRARLRINGFEARPGALPLTPDGSYRLAAEAAGFAAHSEEVRCAGSGRQSVRVALTGALPASWAAGDIRGPALKRLSESHGLQTLVLVEPLADRFRLYLYTPGLSVDELPLREPLKFERVRGAGADGGLPIAFAEAATLLEKHRLAPVRLALGDTGRPVVSDAPESLWAAQSTVRADGAPRWYNSSTFWIVTGILVGGAVAAFFATRDGSVRSQSGIATEVK